MLLQMYMAEKWDLIDYCGSWHSIVRCNLITDLPAAHSATVQLRQWQYDGFLYAVPCPKTPALKQIIITSRVTHWNFAVYLLTSLLACLFNPVEPLGIASSERWMFPEIDILAVKVSLCIKVNIQSQQNKSQKPTPHIGTSMQSTWHTFK